MKSPYLEGICNLVKRSNIRQGKIISKGVMRFKEIKRLRRKVVMMRQEFPKEVVFRIELEVSVRTWQL